MAVSEGPWDEEAGEDSGEEEEEVIDWKPQEVEMKAVREFL